MPTLVFRTVIIYILLIIAIRITGKRQIGELQISELVVTFMLSELAVFPITDKSVPLTHSVIPIFILLSFEVIFSFLQTKSPTFRKLFCGGPTTVINKGRLDPVELAKNRLDVEELLGELRQKGVFDISTVEYAILEENGKLSVLSKSAASPVTPSQLGISPDESGISHPVVVDGRVNQTALVAAGITQEALSSALSRLGVSVSEIFLMTVDDSGSASLYISDSDDRLNIRQQANLSFNGGKHP